MFSREFIDQLPEDLYSSLDLLCKEFNRLVNVGNALEKLNEPRHIGTIMAIGMHDHLLGSADNEELYKNTILGVSSIKEYIQNHPQFINSSQNTSLMQSIEMQDLSMQSIGAGRNEHFLGMCGTIRDIHLGVQEKTLYGTRSADSEYIQQHFSTRPTYQPSNSELERIQDLIDLLRRKIPNCSPLSENHKTRLMQQLEKLQSELHKKMSSLDTVCIMLGTAGMTLGKIGKDAKPLIDCFRELGNIFRSIELRAECPGADLQLDQTDPTPLLPED